MRSEVKAQPVRVLDVLVIGPLMIYGGYALADRSQLAGAALSIFGLTTILYNARNYEIIDRRRQA